MGRTSPEGWCGPCQGRFSRGDWAGCGINSSWLPFSCKVGPNLSFKVTSSLGCWFYELHSLLEGIRYLTLAIDDGDNPGRVIFAKGNSNYQFMATSGCYLALSLHCPKGAVRNRCWKGAAKHPVKCLNLTSKLHFPLDSPTFIPSPTTPF